MRQRKPEAETGSMKASDKTFPRSSLCAKSAAEPRDSDPGCLRCGHCCGPYFALYVGEEDEERWKREGRTDILARLEWERNLVMWDDEGPFNRDTGERFTVCRFLVRKDGRTALCSIHETKPKICRDYPPGSSELCVLWKDDY